MSKQNWFPTLNAALDAEGLIDLWPLGLNIGYEETVRHLADTGETHGKRQKPVYRAISIYRNENGMYERPVHYATH